MRERLGGGSFSTINKLLREYRDQAEKARAAKSQLSEGVTRVIHDAVARASTILEAESHARVEAISKASAESQHKLKRELDEAVREIDRLEAALEAADQARKVALDGQANAEKRETEAQGRVREMEGRIESLGALLESTKSEAKAELERERDQAEKAVAKTQAAIEEAAELRGQLKALTTRDGPGRTKAK